MGTRRRPSTWRSTCSHERTAAPDQETRTSTRTVPRARSRSAPRPSATSCRGSASSWRRRWSDDSGLGALLGSIRVAEVATVASALLPSLRPGGRGAGRFGRRFGHRSRLSEQVAASTRSAPSWSSEPQQTDPAPLVLELRDLAAFCELPGCLPPIEDEQCSVVET